MAATPHGGYRTIKDVDEEIIESGLVELVELITSERMKQIDFNNLDMDETVLLMKCALLRIRAPLIYDGESRIKLNEEQWEIFTLIEEKLQEGEVHFKGPLSDPEIYVRLANVMTATGNNEKAEIYLNRAIEIDPKFGPAWFQLGMVLDRLGRFEEAIRCYDRATRLSPDLPIAWVYKSKTLEDLGKDDEALKALEKAVDIEPDNPELWMKLGNLLYNLGRFSEAKEAYEKGNYLKEISGLDIEEVPAVAEEALSELSESDQNLIEVAENTIARGKRLGADMSEAETLLKEVRRAIDEGEYEKALENAKISIAEADRAIRNRIQHAIDHVGQRISYAKVYIIADRAEMYYNQAQDAMSSGDYEKALELTDKALNSLETTLDLHKKATRAIQNAWARISDANAEGADTSISEALLKEARESLKKGDYERATEFAEQAVKQIVEPKAIVGKKVVERIMKLKARLLEIEKRGIDISDLEKEIEKADMLFENEDFDGARSILDRAERAAEERFNEFLMNTTLDMLMTARAIIGELRGYDFAKPEDIAGIESIIEEADMHFQGKNFLRANEVATKAQLKAQQLKSDYIRIQKDKIDSRIVDNLEILKKLEKDTTVIEGLRSEANSTFKNGELEQGFEILKKALSQSDNLVKETAADIDNMLEDLMESIENASDICERSGMSDELEKLRSRVASFEKSDDPRATITRFISIKDDLESLIVEARNRIIYNLMDEIKQQVDELASYGVDVKDMYNHLKNADMLAKEGEYDDAMETLSTVRSMIGQRENMHRIKRVSELITETMNLMNEIRSNRGDVAEYERKFEFVKKLFRAKDYIEAEKQALELKEEVENTLKKMLMDQASSQITELRMMLEDASEMGSDIDIIKKEVDSAEELFKSGKYADSIKVAESAKKALARLLERRNAIIRLQSVKERLKELKDNGVDISEAKKVFDLCRPLMERGDYAGVLELTEKAEALSREAEKSVKELSKNIIDKILDAQNMIIEIKTKGGKTDEMEKMLQEARSYYHRKDYPKAKELLDKIITEGQNIKDLREIIVRLKGLRSRIDELRERGADTSRVEKIFKKAEPAIKAKRFDIVQKIESMVTEELEHLEKSMELNRKLDELISRYQRLSTKGVKFKIGPNDINAIKMAMDKGDLDTAMKEYEDIYEEITSTEEKYNHVVEIIGGAQLLMKEVEKRGLPLESIESRFRRIMSAMSQGEYSTASSYAEEVEEELEKMLELGAEVQDMLSLAEMKVRELLNMNIPAGEIEAKIDIIKMNLARGDSERAAANAEKLLEDIERLKNRYFDLIARSDRIKAMISDARRQGIDSARAQVYFDQAILARNRGDMDRAEKLLDDIEDLLKSKGYTPGSGVV